MAFPGNLRLERCCFLALLRRGVGEATLHYTPSFPDVPNVMNILWYIMGDDGCSQVSLELCVAFLRNIKVFADVPVDYFTNSVV